MHELTCKEVCACVCCKNYNGGHIREYDIALKKKQFNRETELPYLILNLNQKINAKNLG